MLHEFPIQVFNIPEHERAKAIDPDAQPVYEPAKLIIDLAQIACIYHLKTDKECIIMLLNGETFMVSLPYEQAKKIWIAGNPMIAGIGLLMAGQPMAQCGTVAPAEPIREPSPSEPNIKEFTDAEINRIINGDKEEA